MIAAARIHENLELEQKEAQALAEAVAGVAAHYPLISRGMTPEAAAWMNLLTVAGMIYGPKVAPIAVERFMSAKQDRGTLQ